MASISGASLAFPLVLTAAALAPDGADACPGYADPCAGLEGWADLAPRNAAKIPSDGVLVLQGNHVGEDPFAGVTLEVTRDGQPIAGALEATPHPHALVWRPSAPWVAGATYQVSGAVNNPVGYPECFPEVVAIAATDVTIDTVPGVALAVPAFTATPALTQSAVLSLATLACCEDADPPSQGYGGCGGDYINFDVDECAPTEAIGSFSLEIAGGPVADGPTAEQVVYSFKLDGVERDVSFGQLAAIYGLTEPACVTIDAIDLASGAVTASPEQCFGEEYVGQLGALPLDPSANLDCPLQQCAVAGPSWDTTMCQPLEPAPDSDGPPTTSDTADASSSEAGGSSDTADPDATDEDKACACNETAPPPLAALVLGALLLPRRRRRAR